MADALERVRSPWSLGDLRVPHRAIMGSMHTGLETREDGGRALGAFYRERVEGGAGLVITGGLAVSSVGRGGPDFAVLTDPAVVERMRHVTGEVHAAGGMIAAQLFHAGRYAVLDGLTAPDGAPEHPVAPSPVPWRGAKGVVPHELSHDEVLRTIGGFAASARAAAAAGFDAVEVMASEGYLINQFCSPVTNHREDEWGGDAVRRRSFALELTRAVCAEAQGLPVIVRLSGDDLVPDSTTPEEVNALAVGLVKAGAVALNVGIGWHESRTPTVQSPVPHGAWLGCAERIGSAVRAAGHEAPVIASNRFTDLRDAETVLARGRVDAVTLARPFLADPTLVARSFAGRFDHVNTCIGCDQACLDNSLVYRPASCLVNPRAGHEAELPLAPSTVPRRIAVVGGGPAGLAAALDLARRGHRVVLHEAADELGGQFRLAERIPGKEDYAATPRSAALELAELGAEVRLGAPAGAAELRGVDGVVLATGVVPRRIDLPGAELPHVLTYEQAIRDGVPPGTVAIIGGGGIGVDTASRLVETGDPVERAEEFTRRFRLTASAALLEPGRAPWSFRAPAARVRPGRQVTVMRRSGKFAAGVGITMRWVVLGALRDAGVRLVSDLSYRRITTVGVEVEHADGSIELVPGETVVVCAGQERHNPLEAAVRSAGIPCEVVGGARDARAVDAVRATREGVAASRTLAP